MIGRLKPLLSILLIIVSCFCTTACNNNNSQTVNSSENTDTVPSTSNTETTVWEYSANYDEDYTIKKISYNGDSTVLYSNSSGNDKSAEVYFSIQSGFRDHIFVGLMITEPLSIESIFDYHSDSYTFTINMTDDQGKLSVLKGKANSNSPNILISETGDVRKLIDALHQNGTLTFVLVDDVYPSSKYSFSLETANFANEYRKSGFSVKSDPLFD